MIALQGAATDSADDHDPCVVIPEKDVVRKEERLRVSPYLGFIHRCPFSGRLPKKQNIQQRVFPRGLPPQY